MSIIKTIEAPSGAGFLTDWMREIPTNCVLNKGITGCGATTLAIRQPGHTIIAVPFVSLIQNKVAQHEDVLLGIHGEGDKTAEIADYLATHRTVKIMTTFDSLPKVNSILAKQGFDPYSDIHFVVDEWHTLFQSYLFRNTAVRNLLAETQKMMNVTFVSATPIEYQYWLEEMKHLPELIIQWPDAEKVHIESVKVDKPLNHMASLCHARIKNGGETNYHIFLNSVKGISKIIWLANLSPADARVVCSNSENSGRRNQNILPAGFTISCTTDPVKPINFYTSTCFEGQDIYDENGCSFIVSDGFTNHTKVDISTSLIQICGRIRDSRYKGHITQYYATSKYRNVTLEEFSAAIDKNVKEAEQVAAAMNSFAERYKNKMLEKLDQLKEPYLTVKDGQITVDRNMANLEIVNYKIINGDYASHINMVKALKKNGFVIDHAYETTADPISAPVTNSDKLKFKDVFEEYCDLKQHPSWDLAAQFRKERIEHDKPFVKEAYEILGAEEVRKLAYKQREIKRAITVKSKEDDSVKIVKLVNASIPKQIPVPAKKVKEELQRIYADLGIKSKAKATDLSKWYEIKQTTARIDGISTSCITIIRPLINIGI